MVHALVPSSEHFTTAKHSFTYVDKSRSLELLITLQFQQIIARVRDRNIPDHVIQQRPEKLHNISWTL